MDSKEFQSACAAVGQDAALYETMDVFLGIKRDKK